MKIFIENQQGRIHGSISRGRVAGAENLEKQLFDKRTDGPKSGLYSRESVTKNRNGEIIIANFVFKKIDPVSLTRA